MLPQRELDDLLVGLEEADADEEGADRLLGVGVEQLPLRQQQRHQLQAGVSRLELSIAPPPQYKIQKVLKKYPAGVWVRGLLLKYIQGWSSSACLGIEIHGFY